MRSLLRALLGLLAIAVLGRSLSATWSIILVDVRTGEVAIASATCVSASDLRALSPVVLVGIGAAAAQASIDSTGAHRLLIRDQLLLGTAPAQILTLLAQADPGHQARQYGIVDTQGRAVAFTGSRTGGWAGHLTGQSGTIYYALQGNVLVGPQVLAAAEQAIRTTPGDVPQKLMAAMLAAAAMGGDRRCSGFAKSAHVGYLIVARRGDRDGPCLPGGCAAGSYFLNLNYVNQSTGDPDPVLQLWNAFQTWRTSWIGRPDHHQSEVRFDRQDLPADGRTTATATLTLRDWRRQPIGSGGATIRVALDPASTATVQIGAITDHGNGTYSFPVTAGTAAGIARLRVTADDGGGPVQLSPDPEIELRGEPLWSSSPALSVFGGGAVDFVLQAGPSRAGRDYVLLAGISGTVPGLSVGGVSVPLNPDPITRATFDLALAGGLPGFLGRLDGGGRARARLQVPPGLLVFLLGSDLSLVFTTLSPLDFASNAVTLRLNP